MNVQPGAFLISNERSARLFKVLCEDELRLWQGAVNKTPCVKALCVKESAVEEVVIPTKQLPSYLDITQEINTLDEEYSKKSSDPNVHISDKTQEENVELRGQVRKLEKSLSDLQMAFDLQQKSLEEKQNIIDDFSGSPADIRKSVDGDGIADIRRAASRG